jgi:hypothetical protein
MHSAYIFSLNNTEKIRSWLNQLDFPFDVIFELRPFQLFYRRFDVFLVDILGLPTESINLAMTNLGKLVRGRSSRLYIFWNDESWKEFCSINSDYKDYPNCVNIMDTNLQKIEQIFVDILDIRE